MKKGFTLTELLAVITIMAILAVAAISGYSAMTNNSKNKALEQKVNQIELAAEKFAKNQNVSQNMVISVNKLVVMGYLQPDSSTDDGYSVINNPLDGENMICNLIEIKIVKEEVKVKYLEDKRDCSIIDMDEMDANISISAFKFTNDANRSLAYDRSTNSFQWTKEDVILLVNSSYEDNAYSISYEYGGNNDEKIVNKANKVINVSTKAQEAEVINHYNEYVIKDIMGIFNNKVTVSFNMKDGTIKSKTVYVKIDREAPSGYMITTNDMSINDLSQRKVSMFFDDSNGSGVDGFYYNTVNNYTSGATYVNDSFTPATVAKKELNKGYFYGGRGTYYVFFKDKVGNVSTKALEITVDNFDPKELSCDVSIHKKDNVTAGAGLPVGNGWFRERLTMKFDGLVEAGSNGYKWDFVRDEDITDGMKLRNIVDVGNKPSKTMDENNEMDLTLFTGGVMGFSTRTNMLKTCSETVGIDWTKPTIEFKYTENTTYKQHQKIEITITDNLSGFDANSGTNKVKIKYAWSATNSMPPESSFEEATLDRSGTYQRVLTGTIDDNTINGELMTGKYYFFILGDYIKDRAGNTLDISTPGVQFWFDNTPPTCTNSGSNNNWTNGNRTLHGSCSDAHSGCAKHANSGKYTYSVNGNVSRLYDYEIDSSTESPGTIYDKAGNFTKCKSDQTVRIDKTKPTCKISLNPASPDGQNGWYKASSVTAKATFADNLSKIANSGVKSKGLSDAGISTNDKTEFVRTKNATKITITCYVKDVAGNTFSTTKSFKKDDGSEAKNGGCSKSGGNSKWKNKGPVALTVKLNTKAISGCSTGTQSGLLNDATWTEGCAYNNKVDISNGSFKKTYKESSVIFTTKSGVFITCPSYDFNLYLDKKKPTCTKSSGGSSTWTNDKRTLIGTCKDQDGASGCKANSTKVYNYEINSTKEAANHVFDNAGNESDDCPANQTVRIDKTKPTCSMTYKSGNCTTGGIKVTLKCADKGGSGIKSCDGGGNKTSYTATYTAIPKVTDVAGNSRDCSGVSIQTQTQYAKSTTCNGYNTSCNSCEKTWSSYGNRDCYNSKPSNTSTKKYSCVMSGKEENSYCDGSSRWDCTYSTKTVCTSCYAAGCSGFKNYSGWKNEKLTCPSSSHCNVKTRTLYKTGGTCPGS